jgi:PBP1b-binding outer membrane lipoprotein LpoB
MKNVLFLILLIALISGCANMPIKDGELQINDRTSATIEDLGVARVNNRF